MIVTKQKSARNVKKTSLGYFCFVRDQIRIIQTSGNPSFMV